MVESINFCVLRLKVLLVFRFIWLVSSGFIIVLGRVLLFVSV